MLDGTIVTSCTAGDSLCTCDDTSLTEAEIRALINQLQDGGHRKSQP